MLRSMVIILLMASVLLTSSSCHVPKASYDTRSGKRKLKHYNKLQFGERKKYNNTF